MNNVCVHRGDSRVVLATTAPDVLITDPPYSAHVHSNAVSQSARRGVRKRELGFDYLSPGLRSFTCDLAARTKRWSVIFTDVESAHLWRLGLQARGVKYVRTVPWVRWSMPQLSGDRPPTGCELIILAHGPGKMHWNGPGNLTHFAHKCLRGEGKHRAEKPLDLALDLVNWFSDVGDTVIDPYAGAGTFGLASALLSRGYLGVEQDAYWAGYAQERIIPGRSLTPRDETRRGRWAESQLECQVKGAAE